MKPASVEWELKNYCSLLFNYSPQNTVYDAFNGSILFRHHRIIQNPLGTLASSRTCRSLFSCDFWNASNNFTSPGYFFTHFNSTHKTWPERIFFASHFSHHFTSFYFKANSADFHFILFRPSLAMFTCHLEQFWIKFLCFHNENISDRNFLMILGVLSGFRKGFCFCSQPQHKTEAQLGAPWKLIRVLQLNFGDTLNLQQKLAHNSFLFGSLARITQNFLNARVPLENNFSWIS